MLISKRFYYLSQKIDGLLALFPRNYLPEASLQCLKFSLTDILVNSIFMRYHAFSIQRNLSRKVAYCNIQMRDLPHRDAAGATLTSRGQRLFMFLKTLFIWVVPITMDFCGGSTKKLLYKQERKRIRCPPQRKMRVKLPQMKLWMRLVGKSLECFTRNT